jgi:tetratricopeptide (TPR) repeat protein
VLSGAFWWLVFWTAVGVDPQAWVLRAALCALGFAAGVPLMASRLRNGRARVTAPVRIHTFDHRPQPVGRLGWGAHNALARDIANAVREHTGIAVPALTLGRVLAIAAGALLLLAGMTAVAWTSGSAWILAGWPAGVFLLAYLLEVHPRIVTAHVLLRHFLEETLSPWVDPHRPFVPRGAGEAKGEFLVRDAGELPIRWALAPKPYPGERAGVLQNLLQVLNRHWSFHQFYTEASVVRDYDVPMPAGHRLLGAGVGLVMLAVLGTLGAAAMESSTAGRTFEERLRIGYNQMLEGQMVEARESFLRAAGLRPDRVAPHLYLGHASAAAGMRGSAGRAFELAASRAAGSVPQAFNDYGNHLQREGRLREAIAAYQNALAIDPQNADIQNNVASAHYKLREFEQAVRYLEQVVKAQPNHSRAHTTLGLAREEIGDIEGARAAYETAVEVAPDVAYTQVARDRLAANLAAEDDTPLVLPGREAPAPPPVVAGTPGGNGST